MNVKRTDRKDVLIGIFKIVDKTVKYTKRSRKQYLFLSLFTAIPMSHIFYNVT